jgi:two-component system response regulator AtoC
MMTGFPTLENSVQALRLGADHYVMKPVDPEELQIVQKKLDERKEADMMTKDKIREFIEARTAKLFEDEAAQTE